MHRSSTCCREIVILIVALTLIVNLCSGDWVEIPFLQPSTTTQKTTIIRKNINRPVFAVDSGFMSHVLPPSFAIASDRDSEESEEEEDEGGEISHQSPINYATLSTPVRITSLVDFEELRRRSTTTSTTESPFNGFPEKYSHFQKRIYEYPRVNVSTKLGWTSPKDEMHFVMSSDKTSAGQVDRQPMSNKYQEESIEYLNGAAPGSMPHRPPYQTVNDRVEIPVHSSVEENDRQSEESSSSEEKDIHPSNPNRTVEERPMDKDRFHDFDDYDEVHPLESLNNATIVKRRRRPGPQGQVTIVKVFPPRRHPLRPTADPNSEGGFSGFVNFLKRMQDKFMQRTAKNIGDKIKILQDLKDQLLLSIERKMTTLWRDRNEQTGEADQKKGNRRVKRGGGGWMDYGDHGGGHGGMDFPSAEAALLTISFLTFAVFLIKLVLQVINTIKSKHYTYNSLAGLNGVTGATLKIVNRSRRSTDPNTDDHWKLNILSAINNYKFS
nr:uncharacterized protein LOC109408964 [Aedes albopictus]